MKEKSFAVASVITASGKFRALSKCYTENFFFVRGGLRRIARGGEAQTDETVASLAEIKSGKIAFTFVNDIFDFFLGGGDSFFINVFYFAGRSGNARQKILEISALSYYL